MRARTVPVLTQLNPTLCLTILPDVFEIVGKFEDWISQFHFRLPRKSGIDIQPPSEQSFSCQQSSIHTDGGG